MRRMPHKTADAQRTINEIFQKKKKEKENANTSLYVF